jgi:hypothetical protein
LSLPLFCEGLAQALGVENCVLSEAYTAGLQRHGLKPAEWAAINADWRRDSALPEGALLMSINSILNIGTSGLNAAQTNMRIVADNLANVDTPGYVRKLVDQTAYRAGGVGAGVIAQRAPVRGNAAN